MTTPWTYRDNTSRGVRDGFAASHLDSFGRKIKRRTAQLANAHLEADARARTGFVENQRPVLVFQRQILDLLAAIRFQILREIENLGNLPCAQLLDCQQMFHKCFPGLTAPPELPLLNHLQPAVQPLRDFFGRLVHQRPTHRHRDPCSSIPSMNMLFGSMQWFQFIRNSFDSSASHANRIRFSFLVAMGNTFSMSTLSTNLPTFPP